MTKKQKILDLKKEMENRAFEQPNIVGEVIATAMLIILCLAVGFLFGYVAPLL